MNKVLIDREKRSLYVKEVLSKDLDIYIVVIKANTIGEVKNTNKSYFLVNMFFNLLNKYFLDGIKEYEFLESNDGPYYLIKINKASFIDYKDLKLKLIEIENSHELGRLIDLDLYINDKNSVSRTDVDHKTRKCIICDDQVYNCMRLEKHTIEEINRYQDNLIEDYFLNITKKIIDLSMSLELNLDPKFGLVTPYTNGSHKDMDYSLMLKSKLVLMDYFLEMYKVSYNDDLIPAFLKARKIGLKAEAAMYAATNGVNTYKGLIFLLGVAIVSTTNYLKKLKTKIDYQEIFENVREIGKLIKNDFDNLDASTAGAKFYNDYGLLGVRGEVISGYRSVSSALKCLDHYSKDQSEFSNVALTMTLIHLIGIVDDTVLLKRAESTKRFHYFKDLVSSIKDYNLEKTNQVTNECIKENISFGGSADLLVVTIYLKNIEKLIYLN